MHTHFHLWELVVALHMHTSTPPIPCPTPEKDACRVLFESPIAPKQWKRKETCEYLNAFSNNVSFHTRSHIAHYLYAVIKMLCRFFVHRELSGWCFGFESQKPSSIVLSPRKFHCARHALDMGAQVYTHTHMTLINRYGKWIFHLGNQRVLCVRCVQELQIENTRKIWLVVWSTNKQSQPGQPKPF